MSANAQFLIWIGIMLSTLGVGFAYMGWRLLVPLQLAAPYKQLAWTGLTLMYIVPLASFFLLRTAERWSDALAWTAYISLGLLSFLFVVLVARDAALLAAMAVQKVVEWTTAGPGFLDASRREFLTQTTNLGVMGVAASLTAAGIYEARRRPGMVAVDVPVAGLPAAFDGFRIVQISDLHAGLTIKRDWIETVADDVRAAAPDMIAFTGDMADGSVEHLRNDVEPLASLSAPYGKFFVTGNHEYYSGVEPWVAHARTLGFDALMNEHRIVEKGGARLVIAGVTDYSGGGFHPSHRSDPKRALEGAPGDTTRILLAHQPRSLYQLDGLAPDLVLMGHTHGGQFFPWNLVATIGQPFIKGLNRWGERTWAYVSKGTGYWGPPVRLGARSEITVLTLRKG